MCLLTTQQKALRAKKDIITYKLFRITHEGLISPYRNFKYEKLGRQKTIPFNKQKGIESSFASFDKHDANLDRTRGKEIQTISTGYHSCTDCSILKPYLYPYLNIIECIIPKGAWYYKGYQGLIVSTDLIIPKDALINTQIN